MSGTPSGVDISERSANVLQNKIAGFAKHRCRLVQAFSEFGLLIFVQVNLDAAFLQSDHMVQMQTANINRLIPADTTHTLEEDCKIGNLNACSALALELNT